MDIDDGRERGGGKGEEGCDRGRQGVRGEKGDMIAVHRGDGREEREEGRRERREGRVQAEGSPKWRVDMNEGRRK